MPLPPAFGVTAHSTPTHSAAPPAADQPSCDCPSTAFPTTSHHCGNYVGQPPSACARNSLRLQCANHTVAFLSDGSFIGLSHCGTGPMLRLGWARISGGAPPRPPTPLLGGLLGPVPKECPFQQLQSENLQKNIVDSKF